MVAVVSLLTFSTVISALDGFGPLGSSQTSRIEIWAAGNGTRGDLCPDGLCSFAGSESGHWFGIRCI